MRKLNLFILLSFVSVLSVSQTTIQAEKPIMTSHSPKKATILSAVLPGAGQIYNKKYWKLPLVYGSIGTLYFIGQQRNKKFIKHFKELRYRVNNDGARESQDFLLIEDVQVESEMNTAAKWRDNFYIFAVLAYGLQILDANVDAHFFSFDVSSDLTLQALPQTQVMDKQIYSGVSLRLSFK